MTFLPELKRLMDAATKGKWLAYRAVMKLAHRHNWHHMKPCYPDGDTMLWCHWCGIRIVTKRKGESLAKLNANDINEVNDGGKHEG